MEQITADNKIYIVGDIDHESYKKFSREMTQLEREGQRIHIVLMSDGGIGMVGLAFYDRIKMSPCKVSITAVGLVASAAVVILSAGAHRSMTPNSWAMVHDDSFTRTELQGKRVGGVERLVKQARAIEDHWNGLLARNTKTNTLNWDTMHRQETYLTPTDCLGLGLIDEILQEKS